MTKRVVFVLASLLFAMCACVAAKQYGPARPYHYQDGSTGLPRCPESKWVVCLTDLECAADKKRDCEVCRCKPMEHTSDDQRDRENPETPPGIP